MQGADITETLSLCADHDDLKKQVDELQAQLETAWKALAQVGEYLERSVTSDDWELDAETKRQVAAAVESQREIDAEDRRSLDLFDV